MRVLALVTDAFGGRGGIALYNRDFLKALCMYPACDEVVVLPRIIDEPPSGMPEKLTYIAASAGSKSNYLTTLLGHLSRDRSFDFILCGHINLLPIAGLVGMIVRAPVILEIYGIDAWRKAGLITGFFARKSSLVISISDITRQRFLSWNKMAPKKTHILPNAIHVDQYGVSQKSETLLQKYGLQNKKVLMTLGRISSDEKYKGFDEVIEILPELSKKIPNIAYLIVGDGDDRTRLERKVADLGLEGRVVFTGYVAEDEKADHYRLADVYVMPSTGEGFGFVLLEAMACGIPIVASEDDGTREAVRDGKLGQVVDPGNKAAIQTAILRVIDRPKRIPEGLDYFYFNRFAERLHGILNNYLGTGA